MDMKQIYIEETWLQIPT